MKLNAIISACDLIPVAACNAEREITAAYTSDLLSDVMAHCPEDSILITVQNHINTIAVATLAGVRAIAVVHGRPLPEEMQTLALREEIALLSSRESQFALSCRIGALLRQPALRIP
jgi:hypothetical protein